MHIETKALRKGKWQSTVMANVGILRVVFTQIEGSSNFATLKETGIRV